MAQIGIFLAVIFGAFVFLEDAFLRPTDVVSGVLKEVRFTYKGSENLSYEKSLELSDSWYVNVSINSDEFDSSYRCDITKAQFTEFDEIFYKYKSIGPVPVDVHITYSYIFDVSRCDSVSDIQLTDFIQQEVAKATIKDFYYFGESVEEATKYEVDVELNTTQDKLLGTTRCPVNKEQFDTYAPGKNLLAKLDKNTLSKTKFPYICQFLFEM